MTQKIDYQKICQNLLARLPKKQKVILERRFGLNKKKPETLQKIGDNFGVTRERIRQVQESAIKKLKAEILREKKIRMNFELFENYLEKQGGIKREDILLGELGGDKFSNQVRFLLVLADKFYWVKEKDKFYSFWTLSLEKEKEVEQGIKELFGIFKKISRPLPKERLFNYAKTINSVEFFHSVLEVAKDIERGPLGEYGLTFWPEISPKGVRDIAYLVLKKEKKPLHFKEIAKIANGLIKEQALSKRIVVETLHNELIRDPKFILVGRGTYALKEWGYSEGTVKDIIYQILKKENTPQTKEEIIRKVKAQRMVKVSTILLNLSDREYFLKDKQGRYYLRARN